MTDRKQFITNLVKDAQLVKFTNTRTSTMTWLISAFVFAALLTYISAPYRSSIAYELLSSFQFFFESIIGLASIVLLIYTAFDFAIPSQRPVAKRLVLPLTVLVIWIGFYVFGLMYPALEPSMADKREYCYSETFIYALPILLVSLLWVRKQWPLHPKITGLLLGLAAGSVPALIMQFACMYEPEHILIYHILPGLLVGVVGVVLATLMLRRT
jgi:hypothetical protein